MIEGNFYDISEFSFYYYGIRLFFQIGCVIDYNGIRVISAM